MTTSKLLILFLAVLFAFLSSCKKDEQKCSTLPSEKEKALQSAPATPRTEIWQWKYQDEKYVYVTLPSSCCDNFSAVLYDENCTVHCYPEDGISGNGDGQCNEIKANTDKTLLWRDSR